MTNVLDVILNLIDNMSPSLDAAGVSVDSFSENVEGASNAIDNADEAANSLSYTMSNSDGEVFNVVANDVDNLTDSLTETNTQADEAGLSLQQIGEAASMAGFDISSIDPSSVQETSDAAKDGSQAADEMASGFDVVSGAVSALVGIGLASWISDAVNSAGAYSDQWDRLTVAMGQNVSASDSVESSWSGVVSTISSNTGRGASVIREYLTQMEIMGVNSSDVLQSAFTAISGQAYLTGSSVESIETAFNRVVRTGTIGARQLTSLGISEQRIHEATGLTLDDVNAKLETMDANGRAAYLAMILNASGATEANEAYKVSWDHTLDVLNRAYSAIMRIVGGFVLPVVTPVIEAITGALESFAGVLKSLDPTIKTIIGVILLLVGGLTSIALIVIPVIGILGTLLDSFLAFVGIASVSEIIAAFGLVVAGAGGGVSGLIAVLGGLLGSIGPVGWAILAVIGIIVSAIAIWSTWKNEIIAFKDALTGGNWGSAASMIVSSFSYVGGAIYSSLVNAGQQIWTFFANLPAWIGSNATSWLNMGRNFMLYLLQGLSSLSSYLGTTLNEMMTAMATDGSAQSAGTTAGQSTGKGIIDGIKQWLITNGPLLKQTFVLLFQQLLPLIAQLILQMSAVVAVWFIQAGIKAGQGLINSIISWVNQLPGLLMASLMNALMQVAYWTGYLIGYAISAGSQFVLNFISWVSQLPGQLWGILTSALSAVISFASQSPGQMASAGWGMVNGLASAISGLPGVVWNEIMNIYHTIANAGGSLYNAAMSLGQQIVSGLQAGLDAHSPGEMYYTIVRELGYMDEALSNNNLPGTSQALGSAIANAFDPNITSNSGFGSTTGNNSGTQTHYHIVDLKNVPSGNSDENIASIVDSMITDDKRIKKIDWKLGKLKGGYSRAGG